MSQHTPGPWIWGKDYDGLYGAGPDNEVLTYASYEGMWLAYGSHREANALLIAAAPDLLEALREMYHAFLDPDHIVTDRQEAASLGAYRAIHKATKGIT